MVIDDEVRAALETLRRHAQGNDFELHRIDVLERDLTSPPVAEQIDETHQRFNGVKYCIDKYGRYHRNAGLHVDVWRYYNGDIPTDNVYDVHHRNLNPTDNDISNLQLLTKSEHQRLHCSNQPFSEHICHCCGKKFLTQSPSARFCSKKCGEKWRLASGSKSSLTKCPVCGKVFTRKRPEQIYCSYTCAAKVRSQNTKQPSISRECPSCHKIFTVPKNNPNQVCCSLSCAAKLRCQNKVSEKN